MNGHAPTPYHISRVDQDNGDIEYEVWSMEKNIALAIDDKRDGDFIITACNSYYTHLAEIDMLKEREEELTRALEIAIVWLRVHVTPDEHSRAQAQSWRDLIDKNMPSPPEQTQGEQE